MTAAIRSQRVYDHRLRTLVQNTGDAHLAIRQGVPPSTARGWLRQSPCSVVSIDIAEMTTIDLQREVLALRRRLEKIFAVLRLVLSVLRLSGFSLARSRLPDGSDKAGLLRTIDRCRAVLPTSDASRSSHSSIVPSSISLLEAERRVRLGRCFVVPSHCSATADQS